MKKQERDQKESQKMAGMPRFLRFFRTALESFNKSSLGREGPQKKNRDRGTWRENVPLKEKRRNWEKGGGFICSYHIACPAWRTVMQIKV